MVNDITIGSTSIDDLRLGASRVEKVYLGTDIVWQFSLFDSFQYSGNDGASDITLSTRFEPSLAWIKRSSGSGDDHLIIDSVRGATKALYLNTTGTEDTVAYNFSFNPTSLTFGNGVIDSIFNASGSTYQAFVWKEQEEFFDIVTFSGTSPSPQTVNHNLGVKPKMMLVKSRDNIAEWYVYLDVSGAGAGNYLLLSSTSPLVASTAVWNNTEPTSTQFSVGNFNSNLGNMVAYLFGEVTGKSKFGTYTGNGSTSGPSVNLGFNPSLVIVKKISSGGTNSDWRVFSPNWADNTKSLVINSDGGLFNNSPALITLSSTGFSVSSTSTDVNENTYTYAYMAWA